MCSHELRSTVVKPHWHSVPSVPLRCRGCSILSLFMFRIILQVCSVTSVNKEDWRQDEEKRNILSQIWVQLAHCCDKCIQCKIGIAAIIKKYWHKESERIRWIRYNSICRLSNNDACKYINNSSGKYNRKIKIKGKLLTDKTENYPCALANYESNNDCTSFRDISLCKSGYQ